MADTAREPRQPSRFEKKRNTTDRSRFVSVPCLPGLAAWAQEAQAMHVGVEGSAASRAGEIGAPQDTHLP
jgi:hypothetical protein